MVFCWDARFVNNINKTIACLRSDPSGLGRYVQRLRERAALSGAMGLQHSAHLQRLRDAI